MDVDMLRLAEQRENELVEMEVEVSELWWNVSIKEEAVERITNAEEKAGMEGFLAPIIEELHELDRRIDLQRERIRRFRQAAISGIGGGGGERLVIPPRNVLTWLIFNLFCSGY